MTDLDGASVTFHTPNVPVGLPGALPSPTQPEREKHSHSVTFHLPGDDENDQDHAEENPRRTGESQAADSMPAGGISNTQSASEQKAEAKQGDGWDEKNAAPQPKFLMGPDQRMSTLRIVFQDDAGTADTIAVKPDPIVIRLPTGNKAPHGPRSPKGIKRAGSMRQVRVSRSDLWWFTDKFLGQYYLKPPIKDLVSTVPFIVLKLQFFLVITFFLLMGPLLVAQVSFRFAKLVNP